MPGLIALLQYATAATFLLIGLAAYRYGAAGQVFAVRFVEAAFRKSRDPAARAVDVRSVIDAGAAAFPRWLRPMVVTRFVLVTLGSAIVLLLLGVG